MKMIYRCRNCGYEEEWEGDDPPLFIIPPRHSVKTPIRRGGMITTYACAGVLRPVREENDDH